MGIHGFTKFISEKAPDAITLPAPESLMGRTLAVDASQSLYQFMVAIRDAENYGNLTNEAGVTTSHITGMLSRCIRILELGVTPIYVFDGVPPHLKSGELAKRHDRKAQAEEALGEAVEEGDKDQIKKMAGRTVRVTKQHNQDVKTLLRLMGVPIVEAPGEAEAQCAALCKEGHAYATASEDADSLCFGTPLLLKNLTFSTADKSKGKQLMQINLKKVLESLEFDMDQFIDFCILCGCDYCEPIKGIGPATAFKLISEHKSIEAILENLDSKYTVPSFYPYVESRGFFTQPDVLSKEAVDGMTYTLGPIDEEGLNEFLVNQNQFNPTRVENAIARLKKTRNLGSQQRLESFFGAAVTKKGTGSSPKAATSSTISGKRKSVGGAPASKKRKR